MNNNNLTKLEEIEIELQKTEILLEQIDIKLTSENKEEYMLQYQELKEKYNSLLAEKKKLTQKGNTIWERIPVWMIIYTLILLIVIGIPFVSWMIWIFFAGILPVPKVDNKFLYTLAIFSLPIISLFISWIMYVNFVHKQDHKKIFRYIWIGQAVLILLNAIFLILYIPEQF